LRAGYAGTDSEASGLRAGLGLKFKDISFDYAYSHYGDLGFSHRYELTLRFGTAHSRLTPAERQLLRRAKLAMAQKRFGEATELLDALIQMEPAYRPVRKLVQAAMAGYENQEGAAAKSFNYSGLPAMKPAQKMTTEEAAEAKDLETLLSINEKSSDRGRAEASPSAVKENKP